MIQFLIRRFTIMIPMMALMSVVAFGIIQAPPGDYLQTYIAELSATGDYVDSAEEANLRNQYGLDKPIYIQYLKWIGNLLRGDLGFSLEYQLPVNQLIGERLGLTVLLALFTVLFTWTLSIPIGHHLRGQTVFGYRLCVYFPVIHRRRDT